MFCKYTKEIVHLLWYGSSHVKLNSSMLCRGPFFFHQHPVSTRLVFLPHKAAGKGTMAKGTAKKNKHGTIHPPCKFQPSNGTWHTNKCPRRLKTVDRVQRADKISQRIQSLIIEKRQQKHCWAELSPFQYATSLSKNMAPWSEISS